MIPKFGFCETLKESKAVYWLKGNTEPKTLEKHDRTFFSEGATPMCTEGRGTTILAHIKD